ncbi:glucose-6-phosphate dehydrogenase assembly protein OpcA [Aeromicrobium sp.]|uniref:glucose-6-phosphate dehydrogenase assembly protein OpcA n=1 Tax=Aeromicrobium sp. TaxID=1871063 RepID=UPI0019C50C27|nr:glucose-6-phosphate dehydrogenase assembly protein OpcA [Aeromicrobium sp.]MBC7630768.1 glucose-6-phosphate dehydrogenase assembly protein OpcA [Aeromicrobium sp.]
MEIALEKTNSAEIARALVKARMAAGSPAMDMVLTLLVVTDEEAVAEALRTATTLSREHPSRVIGVILGDGRGGAELNAKVRVGENSSGESILLRISGELTKHAESVVLPLLLPDSPVVVWWPGQPPIEPSKDAIGQFAQRRLTDAEATDSPIRALRAVARKYAPGDTDLSWTRLTPWRALLAAALDQSTSKVIRGEVTAGRNNPAAALLVAWLESRLKVPITVHRSDTDQIARVILTTGDGDVCIERISPTSCHFSVPGSALRQVPLGARTLAELLAEDLRRLDADDIYKDTIKHMLAN